MNHAVRVFNADDEHVFGQPAFRSGLPACNPQRVAFLAEQGVAAITGSDALDTELLGKVHDEAPLRIQVAG